MPTKEVHPHVTYFHCFDPFEFHKELKEKDAVLVRDVGRQNRGVGGALFGGEL